MNVQNTCVNEKATTLECLSHWVENKKKYVIARKVGDENKLANCFNFDVDDYGMRLHTDIYCNSGAKHAFDEAVEYSLRKIKAPCGDEGVYTLGDAPTLACAKHLPFVLLFTAIVLWKR